MPIYADNRKARHTYEILEKFEGGLVLTGAETKAVREGKAKLDGSYVKVMGGELWLVGTHIGPYSKDTSIEAHVPDRRRKMLIHKKELRHLASKSQEKGLTLVPLSFYSLGRRIKVSFAVCRGKKAHDKRQQLKERDLLRSTRRFLRGESE